MIIHAEDGYVLRSFAKQDAKDFFKLSHNDKLIKEFVPYAYPNDIKEAEEMIETYSNGDCKNDFYLVIEKENQMIGIIIAVRTIGLNLDTSAVIYNQYRNNGIMTISMNAFIKWLKENTNYEKLCLCISKRNKASIHQSKKIGSILEKDESDSLLFNIILEKNKKP